jgi:hypothetical protein
MQTTQGKAKPAQGAVKPKKTITLTIILPASTRVTAEMVQELDRLLWCTEGGKSLYDAVEGLHYDFLNGNKPLRFMNRELLEDLSILQHFLAKLKWKFNQ